jgi:hypothetical protein
MPGVVPDLEVLQFLTHLLASHRDHDNACAKVPQRQDEAYDGDTPVLSDSAVVGLDSASPTPVFEAGVERLPISVARKLPLVAGHGGAIIEPLFAPAPT